MSAIPPEKAGVGAGINGTWRSSATGWASRCSGRCSTPGSRRWCRSRDVVAGRRWPRRRARRSGRGSRRVRLRPGEQSVGGGGGRAGRGVGRGGVAAAGGAGRIRLGARGRVVVRLRARCGWSRSSPRPSRGALADRRQESRKVRHGEGSRQGRAGQCLAGRQGAPGGAAWRAAVGAGPGPDHRGHGPAAGRRGAGQVLHAAAGRRAERHRDVRLLVRRHQGRPPRTRPGRGLRRAARCPTRRPARTGATSCARWPGSTATLLVRHPWLSAAGRALTSTSARTAWRSPGPCSASSAGPGCPRTA